MKLVATRILTKLKELRALRQSADLPSRRDPLDELIEGSRTSGARRASFRWSVLQRVHRGSAIYGGRRLCTAMGTFHPITICGWRA
jgi:hypothetical protein